MLSSCNCIFALASVSCPFSARRELLDWAARHAGFAGHTKQRGREQGVGLGRRVLRLAVPLVQAPKFYPADDVKTPLKRRTVAKPARLRASIKPGTVLILLAGHFKGKRVIFLKQLPSGLLLVTGPFKVNGVRSPSRSPCAMQVADFPACKGCRLRGHCPTDQSGQDLWRCLARM